MTSVRDDPTEAPLELPDEIVRAAVPDDDIVLAYVTRGVLARYVEGVAAKNAAFREELRACIEGLEDAGEASSAAAKAWYGADPRTHAHEHGPEPGHEQGVASAVPANVVPLAPKREPLFASWQRWTFAAMAAAFVLGIAVHHQHQRNETRRMEAQKQRELAEQQAQLDRLIADLKAQQDALAGAQAELANARSDQERMMAQAKLAAAQEKQRATASQFSAVKSSARAGGSTGSAKAACNCQPGDPLCSCL